MVERSELRDFLALYEKSWTLNRHTISLQKVLEVIHCALSEPVSDLPKMVKFGSLVHGMMLP